MAECPSIWILLAVTAAIAAAAFAVSQVLDGTGVMFAFAGSIAWCSLSQRLWGRKIHG